jgi:hypothetical protein
MLRRVDLVSNDVSENQTASVISLRRIGELGTLAVSMNRSTPRRNTSRVLRLLVTANPLSTRRFFHPDNGSDYVRLKRRFLQKPHGITYQKTAFFDMKYAPTVLGVREQRRLNTAGLDNVSHVTQPY